MDNKFWEETEKNIETLKKNGRRPRMLVAKMGQMGMTEAQK